MVSFAQKRSNSDTKGILYTNERAIDMRFLTHGWSADVYWGTLKTYYKTNYYRLSIGNLNHLKETRNSTDFKSLGLGFGYRNYRYGKQNYVCPLQGGWGTKHYYTEKANKKGVSLAVNYSGGITAGLVIPYFLDISNPKKKGVSNIIRYTKETSELFLNRDLIRGKSSFFRGIKYMSVVPGVHAQAGVHLDWGAFDRFLYSVEVGTQLQIFPKKMPIMVNEENKPYFFNLYVSLQFGKRY
jgi:hypothetical protein